MNWRHRGKKVLICAVALLSAMALPAAAQPVGVAVDVPSDAHVIDIRAEDACFAATLPGARCLPVSWLIDGDGKLRVGFHALRWLFGTVGLSGEETLVVFDGSDGATSNAYAVAALAHVAGQARVMVYAGSAELRGSGEGRAFSREAVYTAPMRTNDVALAEGEGPMLERLAVYGRDGGVLTFWARG